MSSPKPSSSSSSSSSNKDSKSLNKKSKPVNDSVSIRGIVAEDVESVSQLLFDAFIDLDKKYSMIPFFPTLESAQKSTQSNFNRSDSFGLVALIEEKVVGILFYQHLGRQSIGISPLAVDPKYHNKKIGKLLVIFIYYYYCFVLKQIKK